MLRQHKTVSDTFTDAVHVTFIDDFYVHRLHTQQQ